MIGLVTSLQSALAEFAVPLALSRFRYGVFNGLLVACRSTSIYYARYYTALRGAAYLVADGQRVINSKSHSLDGNRLSWLGTLAGDYRPLP